MPRYDVPKAAPEPLRLVQRFVNTVDHEHRREWIGTTAELACDRARSPEDLRVVASTLVAGRHELARARALLAGDEPPASPRPCFFDARHGPASQVLEWNSQRVAACAADADRIERGAPPDVRHVLVKGRPVPYWDAPPEFRPWIEGLYGGATPVN